MAQRDGVHPGSSKPVHVAPGRVDHAAVCYLTVTSQRRSYTSVTIVTSGEDLRRCGATTLRATRRAPTPSTARCSSTTPPSTRCATTCGSNPIGARLSRTTSAPADGRLTPTGVGEPASLDGARRPRPSASCAPTSMATAAEEASSPRRLEPSRARCAATTERLGYAAGDARRRLPPRQLRPVVFAVLNGRPSLPPPPVESPSPCAAVGQPGLPSQRSADAIASAPPLGARWPLPAAAAAPTGTRSFCRSAPPPPPSPPAAGAAHGAAVAARAGPAAAAAPPPPAPPSPPPSTRSRSRRRRRSAAAPARRRQRPRAPPPFLDNRNLSPPPSARHRRRRRVAPHPLRAGHVDRGAESRRRGPTGVHIDGGGRRASAAAATTRCSKAAGCRRRRARTARRSALAQRDDTGFESRDPQQPGYGTGAGACVSVPRHTAEQLLPQEAAATTRRARASRSTAADAFAPRCIVVLLEAASQEALLEEMLGSGRVPTDWCAST